MVDFLDTAVSFAKDKIDSFMDFWEGLDENRRKLFIGCAIAAVSIIVLASIAYSIGYSKGRKSITLEKDF